MHIGREVNGKEWDKDYDLQGVDHAPEKLEGRSARL